MILMKGVINNWNEVNSVTIGFLQNIPSQNYLKKSFDNRFRSFAWEFACLYTTREMYAQGIEKGKIDETITVTSESEAESWDQTIMKKKLEEINVKLMGLVSRKKEILFWGKKTSVEVVVSWLCQHEQLHFGKLMLYCAASDITLPPLLKEMWGKDSFKKKL